MKALFIVIALILSVASQARTVKIVAQQFMPLGGAGDDGKMAGVHFEITKAVCEKMKYTCTSEVMPLARGLDQVKNGEAQIILGVAKNAEREAIMHFPGLITQVGYTFFVKKGEASKYKKLEDFKGKTIGVHGGSATHKNLLELNDKIDKSMKLVEEATAETSPRKLAGDRYGAGSAIYCARAVCAYQAMKENLAIEPVSFDGLVQSHSFGISKKSIPTDEFEKIKKAVGEVMKTDKIRKLITENNLIIHPDYK